MRNHRQNIKWLIEKGAYYGKSEIEVVKYFVDRLIENLYVPCNGKLSREGHTFVTDKKKLKKYKLDNASVNWGDLKVIEVAKVENEDKFIVWIDEASPGYSNFHEYLRSYMKKWGWEVEIITEW